MAKYLYADIKEYVLKIIRENKDQPNFRLPSENQLAARFSTTRITAKRALTDLQEEGYLYRIHGKGTFISPTVSENKDLRSGCFVCIFLPNLNSRFITDMICGARLELQRHGIHLLIVNETESEINGNLFIRQYVDLGIKGFIVFPNHQSRYAPDLLSLALNKFPVVFVDRTLRDFDVSCVTSDHTEMAKKAVQFLFDRGCRNVGFITRPPEHSTSIYQRINGYEKAHIENARTLPAKRVLYLNRDDPDQEETILRFLRDNPEMDGLLTYGSIIGENVYRAITKAGIHVPEQLQVIFLDDEYADFADLLPFSPTCIKQNSIRIGQEAARLICKYIDSRNVTIDKIIIGSDIIERGSTVHSDP
ncbi:MAG: substrate-binding domain-containing protein [Clostridia bacterium]|nr:substrate-binding domain-containing protein [Clostridia bacterium]